MLLVYNANLIDANINVKNGAILVDNGKIQGFPSKKAVKTLLEDSSVEKIDAEGKTVMPSFIDMHAHFRDPGFTQKEDIESGCKAAAKGGFGTVVLMPNTNPVCSSMEMAKTNIQKAKDLGIARVFQTVSITKDFEGTDFSHLETLDREIVPVISEDGKEVKDSSVMFEAMKVAAKKNLVVSCHCEDPFLADAARPYRKEAMELLKQNKTKEAAELLTKANELLELAEDSATARNIMLAKKAGCHLHLCHVSTEKCIGLAEEAKCEGVNLTYEITPHHFSLSGQELPFILQVVNPPLRKNLDRYACMDALMNGSADCIATDHAPHTDSDKENGAPGFSGIETAFASTYTNFCLPKFMKLKQVSEKMSYNPAKILGMDDKIGLLKEGYEADFVIVDLNKKWKVRGAEFVSKGKYTPLEGIEVTGKVVKTFFNGKCVYSE